MFRGLWTAVGVPRRGGHKLTPPVQDLDLALCSYSVGVLAIAGLPSPLGAIPGQLLSERTRRGSAALTP